MTPDKIAFSDPTSPRLRANLCDLLKIMRHIFVLILLLVPALQASAAPREWKSADGQRSIRGEFISRDAVGVTIRRNDGRQVPITLEQLHPDDRSWIAANHPLPGTEVAPPSAVFDQLAFGDSRAEVTRKLESSKFVEASLDNSLFGRTGLNGIFRTRSKIGGLDAMLYFDWDEKGGLKEITLHSTPLPASALNDRLIPCWKEFIELLTTLHGKPVSENPHIDLAPIRDGAISGTHLWKLENSANVMLGPAREGNQYQITVRFTTKDIKPVIISASPPPTRQSP